MNVVDIDELLDELEASEALGSPPKLIITEETTKPTKPNVEIVGIHQQPVGFDRFDDDNVDLDEISDSELEAYLNSHETEPADLTPPKPSSGANSSSDLSDSGEFATPTLPSDLNSDTAEPGKEELGTNSHQLSFTDYNFDPIQPSTEPLDNFSSALISLSFPTEPDGPLIGETPGPMEDSTPFSIDNVLSAPIQTEVFVVESSPPTIQSADTVMVGVSDDIPSEPTAVLPIFPPTMAVMDFSPPLQKPRQEYPEDLNPFGTSDTTSDVGSIADETVVEADPPTLPSTDSDIQFQMEVQPAQLVEELVVAEPTEDREVMQEVPSETVAPPPAEIENSQPSAATNAEPRSLIQSTHDLGSDWILQLTESEMKLGKEAPLWIPDMDTHVCMLCEKAFSLIRRRHHCRACGRVLCGECCSSKAKLAYLEDKDARVCVKCNQTLLRITEYEALKAAKPYVPYGGNAAAAAETTPKVPVGIRTQTKPESSEMSPPTDEGGASSSGAHAGAESSSITRPAKRSSKQVTFRDGIKPGGDLTEPSTTHSRPTRTKLRRSKVNSGQLKIEYQQREMECLIGEGLLPNFKCGSKDCVCIESPHSGMEFEMITGLLRDGECVEFLVKRNLRVFTKIANLNCCANMPSWNCYTDGLHFVGQEEILLVIEKLADEELPSTDVFEYFNAVYDQAYNGQPVSDLDHTLFANSSRVSFANGFMGCKEFVGVVYVKPSFQCFGNLSIPQSPYLIGLLFQRWEAPWVKIFPQRLILRLGAECGSYPSPVISLRLRRQVFFEIGHTILTLLADFRNYSYTLTTVPGASLQLMPKKTLLLLPKLQYNRVVKVVQSSNEHVVAFGLGFSREVDSQLVCIQQEDGVYQSQIISKSKTPNVMTGASFIVFNGSLKSSVVGAKSSIVEDGVMIQIRPETMEILKEKLKSQENHTIICGDPTSTDHLVFTIEWFDVGDQSDQDGFPSPIDGVRLSHLPSLQLQPGTADIQVDNRIVRLSAVFVHLNEEAHSHSDGDDIVRLSRLFGLAIQSALAARVGELMALNLNPISLRITVSSDEVEYSVGSQGERLPTEFNEIIDSAMVPVLHQQAANQPHKVVLELLFHILTVF